MKLELHFHDVGVNLLTRVFFVYNMITYYNDAQINSTAKISNVGKSGQQKRKISVCELIY